MNQFEKFDLIVIGCGPAGYAGAMRAMDINKKVAIIEKNEIGGAGVLWGALTSKCLWELSKDYAGASRVDRGFRCSSLEVKFTEVRKNHQDSKVASFLQDTQYLIPGKNEEGCGPQISL